MQTRKNSLLEALVNILSGAILAFIVSQSLVISSPLIAKYLITGFHFELSMGDNIFVTFVLTCVSIFVAIYGDVILIKRF